MVRAKGSSGSDGKGPRGAGTPSRTSLKLNHREEKANEAPQPQWRRRPRPSWGTTTRTPSPASASPQAQPCPAQGDLSLRTLTCFVTCGSLFRLGNLFAGL